MIKYKGVGGKWWEIIMTLLQLMDYVEVFDFDEKQALKVEVMQKI